MNIIKKIKRAETPFYEKIKSSLLYIYKIDIPACKIVYKTLYYIRLFCIYLFGWIKSRFWEVPVFKSLCKECGKNLILPHGLPTIIGKPRIYVGDNVLCYRSRIETAEECNNPTLKIGNNVVIGPSFLVRISNEITIGSYCLIGANNQIMDYKVYKDNDEDNMNNDFVVIEENVWTGRNVSIERGVTIGKNSIISANSLVINDIPENVIAMGVPARIILKNVDKFYKDK